jgi:hypothetical protein
MDYMNAFDRKQQELVGETIQDKFEFWLTQQTTQPTNYSKQLSKSKTQGS